MFKKKMNGKGITLIELIIVMVIIAIGAALMAPNIGGWLPNYRLRSATREIASTMRVAQMKAVSNNLPYRVNLDDAEVGAGNYILQYNSGGVWFNEGVLQTLPSGIIISANSIPAKHANFNPNSTSSTGSLTLQNTKGSQRRITLTPATGRVTVD
jgi:prepilin-type N-terminal cleavage/methylation domain-containing protein